MNEEGLTDEDIQQFHSGYRAGRITGTIRKALEILGWEKWKGEPQGIWQEGFIQGFSNRIPDQQPEE